MVHIQKFVFSPFQENTYVVYNDRGACWIIDPGCYYPEEKQELAQFIADHKLSPERLLNTHCHLDHVFGNAWVHKTFDLSPEYHQLDQVTMEMAPISANMYGIPGFEPSPKPKHYLSEKDELKMDDEVFEMRFCPGHAPGHLVFIHHEQKIVIGGDVLFRESIGRTDLPGGDHETLLRSIRNQLYVLEDDYIVYSGHGDETSIGHEKNNNPFVRLSV